MREADQSFFPSLTPTFQPPSTKICFFFFFLPLSPTPFVAWLPFKFPEQSIYLLDEG